MKIKEAQFYQTLSELLETGERIAVATVIATSGSTPRKIGAKMIVRRDGSTIGTIGGGAIEKKVVEECLSMISIGGEGKIFHYKLRDSREGGIGAACGGEADVFIEVAGQETRLLICGGGHVGQALAEIGFSMGYEIIVVEDRKEFSKKERFPFATILRTEVDDPAIINHIDENTAIVIVTRSHLLDKKALKAYIRSSAFYIGMIGSRKKVRAIFNQLENEGVKTQDLRKIFAPIGLEIGAETPHEIAISILAEIIAVKGFGSTQPHPGSMKLKWNSIFDKPDEI